MLWWLISKSYQQGQNPRPSRAHEKARCGTAEWALVMRCRWSVRQRQEQPLCSAAPQSWLVSFTYILIGALLVRFDSA